METTKTCSKCMIKKPLDSFSNDKRGRLSKCLWCKPCTSEYKKSRRRLDQERRNEQMKDPEYKAQIRARDRAWRRDNPILYLYASAKNRAKRKGLEFNIDKTDIVLPTVCPLLGIPFVQGTKGDYRQAYSLDRRDTTKGYIKGNVWIISSIANTMKSDATREELKTFAKNILDIL